MLSMNERQKYRKCNPTFRMSMRQVSELLKTNTRMKDRLKLKLKFSVRKNKRLIIGETMFKG